MKKVNHQREKPIIKNTPSPKLSKEEKAAQDHPQKLTKKNETPSLPYMRGGVLTTDEEQAARNRQRLIKKYETASFFHKRGGIFTTKTRKKLIAKSGQTGPDIGKNAFWYKVRRNIETALLDLELFVEAAGGGNVNQVMTQETLAPVVSELVQRPDVIPPPPDQAQLYLERAKIADLFIREGFEYLSSMNSDMMTLPHRNTREEAIDLSHFLLATFKSKWPYYPEIHGNHE